MLDFIEERKYRESNDLLSNLIKASAGESDGGSLSADELMGKAPKPYLPGRS